jgi:hypothetical protein
LGKRTRIPLPEYAFMDIFHVLDREECPGIPDGYVINDP